MGLNNFTGIIAVLFIFAKVQGQEDSLRSALNAIDRRQRDLTDYPSRYDDKEYGYPMEKPEDLAFLKAYNNERGYGKNVAVERALLDYLDDDSDHFDENDVKKKISSSFRERLEEDKEKQMKELAHSFMANEDVPGDYSNDNDEDYEELIHELWDKYQQQYDRPRAYASGDVNKRYYYPKFGLDSAGLRKRSRYFNPDGPNDSLYLLNNYIPRDELLNRLQEDTDDDIDPNYIKNRYYQRERKFNRFLQGSYPYSQVKRFPVAKRSSEYSHDLKPIHEQKRSANKKQTDPKVEKDLSHIFGTKNSKTATVTKEPDNTTTAKPKRKNQKESKQKTKTTKKEEKSSKETSTKEEPTHHIETDQPLQIKKKSVDWSDYFGLDRRKKSDSKGDLDNEWLLERYHKAVAMATKRNAEFPLQSFHNHDQLTKKEASTADNNTPTKDTLSPEEKKINEMDTKLKNMEDTIVDDALKYTGAHEGVTDSKEVQEVKDKVISRLAAAYSLEKMRNALGEYKLAVAKERERLKHQRKPVDDYMAEEKRTSVPRKQAVDEDRENTPEADNNIKCAQGNEDCQEQNYRTPIEILEHHFGNGGECPSIQRACNEVGLLIGHNGHIFESACTMHQMCLLCSNNSWFSPTRQCNALFLEKAYELCKGKAECQKDAQRSVRYLLDVNHSLQSQPLLADECELACPSESDIMSDVTDRR